MPYPQATLSPQGEGARTAHGSRLTVYCLLLTLLLATALRFYHLDAQSFWNDEGNSARLSGRSTQLIIEGTASDIHPPLYYLILRGWRERVGDTEFGLGSFSAFVGVGLVAVTIALGRAMWGRQPGGVWLAGLFVAINPALIYYSQETRMYELLAFLALLSTLILWKWLKCIAWCVLGNPSTTHAPRNTHHVSFLITYSLIITAGLYTHYFFPTILLVHGFIMASAVGRNFFNRQSKIVNRQSSALSTQHSALLLHWFLALIVASLLYLPWLPIFLRQASGRDTTEYGLCLFRIRGRADIDKELMSSSFRKKFSKGTTPDPDPAKNPPPAESRAVFDKVYEQTLLELPAVASEVLQEPVDMPYAVTATKLGGLLFCSHHEMLHAGQIGLLRRLIGKSPVR